MENSRAVGPECDLEAVAVGLEYGVFLSVKSAQVYKLTVHKKVCFCMCSVWDGVCVCVMVCVMVCVCRHQRLASAPERASSTQV